MSEGNKKKSGKGAPSGGKDSGAGGGNFSQRHRAATADEDDDKPRRLEPATSAYLAQIEADLDAAMSSPATDPADIEVLVENVLEEIRVRTASAACDRVANAVVEKLCLAAPLRLVLVIFERIAPYAVFLALNRHSSHVLESAISRLCYLLQSSSIPDDIDEAIASEKILSVIKPLLENFVSLSQDMNGSHVVRAALSALAGLPVISEKRGKQAKHQHSVPLSRPLASLLAENSFLIDKSNSFPVPDSFHDFLRSTIESGLLGKRPDELQAIVVDPAGAATMTLLLRILYSPGIIEEGPGLADRLVRGILQWSGGEGDEGPTVFYAMCGERSGSFFLETVMECAEISFIDDVYSRSIKGSLKDYMADGAANFVIQSILRRLGSDARTDDIKTVETILDLINSLCEELLITKEAFATLALRRSGALLALMKAVETAACHLVMKLKSLREEQGKKKKSSSFEKRRWTFVLSKFLLEHWGADVSSWPDFDSLSVDSIDEFISEHLPSWDSAASLGPLVEGLTSRMSAQQEASQTSSKENGAKGETPASAPKDASYRETVQLVTAKLIGAIFEFSHDEAKIAKTMLFCAVSSLKPDILYLIATSGPMSKAILDNVFKTETRDAVKEKTFRSLESRIVDLSCHYIGQHVVKNYFLNARRLQRERIVLALVGPSVTQEMSDRLRRCKEGQGVLRHTHAELWSRNPAEWKAQMNKHDQGLALLRDLNIIPSSEPSAPAASAKEERPHHSMENSTQISSNLNRTASISAPDALNAAATVAAAADGKKKRKRRRGGKAKQTQLDGGDSNDDGDDGEASDNEPEPEPRPAKRVNNSDNASTKPDASRSAEEVQKPTEPVVEMPDRKPAVQASAPSRPLNRDDNNNQRFTDYRSGPRNESRAPPASFSPAFSTTPSKRADMSLVRSLQNGKMMSKSMLSDAISRLENEKKML